MKTRLHPESPSAGSSGFDVCVVGHVTKDILKAGQATTLLPGGTAYYTALALKSLGLNVAVVTKGAKEDRNYLLHELLANKVSVFWEEGDATTVFENTYSGDNLGARTQTLKAMGTAFAAKDIAKIRAKAFHLGPLFRRDMALQVLEKAAKEAKTVSLDVQGMVRPARLGQVVQQDWPDKKKWLGLIHVLKANAQEAIILSGEKDPEGAAAVLSSFGPREVVITLGGRGSIVYAEGTIYTIPGFSPRKLVDPTGCGDTYAAAYLCQRLRGSSPEGAGRFAAATATLKLEGLGPFKGAEEEVVAAQSFLTTS
ncbi:MAG: PfkB family carbohydrate kinase [Thermodesulfobacteriota bacterium]|nr:PfkB family carbohydrate kinase [Thermodesulfobacteriota bacterium]